MMQKYARVILALWRLRRQTIQYEISDDDFVEHRYGYGLWNILIFFISSSLLLKYYSDASSLLYSICLP